MLIIILSAYTIRSFSVPMSSSEFHSFSFIRFRGSGPMLRSFVHWEMNFVNRNWNGYVFILLLIAIKFDEYHSLEMLSFLQCKMFDFFVKKKECWQLCNIYVWILNSILFISMSVFMSIAYHLHYYSSIIQCLGCWYLQNFFYIWLF